MDLYYEIKSNIFIPTKQFEHEGGIFINSSETVYYKMLLRIENWYGGMLLNRRPKQGVVHYLRPGPILYPIPVVN
jgi:hypothetical protein